MSVLPMAARAGRFTPWALLALREVGLSRRDLDELTPQGWRLHGHARTAKGPWIFQLVNEDRNVVARTQEATAHRIADVREAIAGLLASVTPDLEMQLRASLYVLGETE